MQKTTAKVERRMKNVPWIWIPYTFCRVKFCGFRAKEMEQKWNAVENERVFEYQSIYNENLRNSIDLRSQADVIYKRVKESKPFYRFWYNKAEKKLLAEAQELSNQAHELKMENDMIASQDVYECNANLKRFLQQNGFAITHTSFSNKEDFTEIEVWTLEE